MSKRIELLVELEKLRDEMQRVVDLPECVITHKGGRELGLSDLLMEEVIILEELTVMSTGERQLDPNTVQVGGEHYREVNQQYQHWDLVAEYGMSYFIGNMTKYLCRWHKKDGVKDLEKSLHYLEKLINLSLKCVVPPPMKMGRFGMQSAERFCIEQGLSALETSIVLRSIIYTSVVDLEAIRMQLGTLISQAKGVE